MNSFVVILSCLAAVTLASPTPNIVVEYLANGDRICRHQNCNRINPWDTICPPVNCPPAVRDPNCGAPDCSLPGNRLRLHPHPDPNFYYQCSPISAVGPLVPLRRPCGCGTLFSAIVDENRCVHPEEWRRDCPNQPAFPIVSQEFCRPECPTCDDNGNLPSPTLPPPLPTLPPPLPTLPPPGPTNPPPNGCPCICVCIWWPCQPCPSNCPCNNNNNNNVNNQSPWAPQPPQQPWAPQPPQQPWAPQPPQNNPWQQPQQPWQPQPPQSNPWDQQRPQWFDVEADVE